MTTRRLLTTTSLALLAATVGCGEGTDGDAPGTAAPARVYDTKGKLVTNIPPRHIPMLIASLERNGRVAAARRVEGTFDPVTGDSRFSAPEPTGEISVVRQATYVDDQTVQYRVNRIKPSCSGWFWSRCPNPAYNWQTDWVTSPAVAGNPGAGYRLDDIDFRQIGTPPPPATVAPAFTYTVTKSDGGRWSGFVRNGSANNGIPMDNRAITSLSMRTDDGNPWIGIFDLYPRKSQTGFAESWINHSDGNTLSWSDGFEAFSMLFYWVED